MLCGSQVHACKVVSAVLLASTDKNWNIWPCLFFKFCNSRSVLKLCACSWPSHASRKQNLAYVLFIYGRPGTASTLKHLKQVSLITDSPQKRYWVTERCFWLADAFCRILNLLVSYLEMSCIPDSVPGVVLELSFIWLTVRYLQFRMTSVS